MGHRLAELLTGQPIGSQCDACTRPIANGDRVYAHSVRHPDQSWRLRRVWCPACLDPDLSRNPGEPEQAMASGVSWRNQLAAVEVVATVGTDSEILLGED